MRRTIIASIAGLLVLALSWPDPAITRSKDPAVRPEAFVLAID
jgi:hypothetical protein